MDRCIVTLFYYSAETLIFSFPIEYEFLRRAQRLILSMSAAVPAAGTAHPFFKFRDNPVHVLLSFFSGFNGDGPANPFVTGKRGNILPLCERF